MKFTFNALALSLSLVLVGCGGSSEENGGTSSAGNETNVDSGFKEVESKPPVQIDVDSAYSQIEGDLDTLGADIETLKAFEDVIVQSGSVRNATTKEYEGLNGNTLYTVDLFNSRYAKGSDEWNGSTPNDFVLTKIEYPQYASGKSPVELKKTHQIYSNVNNEFKPENRKLGTVEYHYFSPDYGYSVEKEDGSFNTSESVVLSSKLDSNTDAMLVNYQKTPTSPIYTVVYDKVDLSGKTLSSVVSGQLRYTYGLATSNFEGYSRTDKFPANSYAYIPRFVKVSEHYYAIIRNEIEGYSDTFDTVDQWKESLKAYNLKDRTFEINSNFFGAGSPSDVSVFKQYANMHESFVNLGVFINGGKVQYSGYQPTMIYRPNINADTSKYSQILFSENSAKALKRTLYDSVLVAM